MLAPLSVIVPTLNSAGCLPGLADCLVEGVRKQMIRELVISDGGSEDGTEAIADGLGARFIVGGASRGRQLAAGARIAGGRWFLFLHADTVLATGWSEDVAWHMTHRPELASHFRLGFIGGGFCAGFVAGWANFRSIILGLPYGDQGLLISRQQYEQSGGYPDIPLMEDVAIARALRKRIRPMNSTILTDPRRYQEEGWLMRGSRNLITLVRYLLGTSPATLARGYNRRQDETR